MRDPQNMEVSIGKALFFDDKVFMLGSTYTVWIHYEGIVVTDGVVLCLHTAWIVSNSNPDPIQ